MAENTNFKTLYLFEWYFFRFEILVTRSFRNSRKISHNTESKIWSQFCDVIVPAKMSKLEKQRYEILQDDEFYIAAKFI